MRFSNPPDTYSGHPPDRFGLRPNTAPTLALCGDWEIHILDDRRHRPCREIDHLQQLLSLVGVRPELHAKAAVDHHQVPSRAARA